MAIATGTALALGSMAVGAGTSIYGAKKQAKAQKEANAQRQALADQTNAYNYQMYLESLGVGPDGQPVNVRLPRYMYAQVGRKRRLVPRGTAAPSTGRITSAVTVPQTAPRLQLAQFAGG